MGNENDGTATRRLLIGGGLAAMATGGALATGRAEAAPATDPWRLGGNTGVTTGNVLGTNDAAPLVLRTGGVDRARLTPTGRLGVGTTTPSALVHSSATASSGVLGSTTGASYAGVVGQHLATTGTPPGVLGETSSTSANAVGVLGRVNPTSPGASSGVRGHNNGRGGTGVGVWGSHAASGYGVLGTTVRSGTGVRGESPGGTGVFGEASGSEGTGVVGRHSGAAGTAPGVLGETDSYADNAAGVIGRVVQTDPGASSGVWGINEGTGASGVGVWGSHAGQGYGVLGTADARGTGVRGEASGYAGVGVAGENPDGHGVRGSGDIGVEGVGTQFAVSAYGIRYGVYALARYVGVYGAAVTPLLDASFAAGVYGARPDGTNALAGYFYGPVHVDGTLSKQAGSFKIDHPLDPERRWLSHSFVESPDMMNVYNGNVVLGRDGTAVVELPAYFAALNRDFRYQLTCLGAHAPVYVAREVEDNRFAIAGGTAGLKVSWQVTGIRQDDYASANPIVVEEPKVGAERGTRTFVPPGSKARRYQPVPED